MIASETGDLALVVADKDMERLLDAVLRRPKALSIRPVTYDIAVHPGHDGGVRTSGVDLLSLFRGSHAHGLLVLDVEGSGARSDDPGALEAELDARLLPVWGDRAASVAIFPELDVWMWGSDNALREPFGWDRASSIRDWLVEQGFEMNAEGKPVRPKEAVEAVVKSLRKPRSSALYRSVAEKISLSRCTDPAFARLRRRLEKWFPPLRS